MIKKVVLDLDGPLLEGSGRHYSCYRDILVEQGFVPMEKDRYWAMKRSRLDRRQQLAVSRAEGIYHQFLSAWMERIETRRYLSMDHLQPGAMNVLSEWRRCGIEMVLVTLRNQRDNLLWQLHKLGVEHLFSQIVSVGTGDGVEGKALAVLPWIENAPLDQVLWIGDTEVDIAAARRLGTRVCAVACGLRTADFLSTLHPDFLCADLASINLEEMCPDER